MLKHQRHCGPALGVVLAVSAGSSIARGAPPEGADGTLRDEAASAIVLAIDGTQDITVRRTSATTSAEGRTWSGVVQETGERALLMRWSGSRLFPNFSSAWFGPAS